MARKWRNVELPRGVEVAEDNGRSPTVRIRFKYRGVACRELSLPALRADGKIAVEHIKFAADKLASVRLALQAATPSAPFKYGDHFPESARCKQFGERVAHGVLFEKLVEEYRATYMPSLREVTRLGYNRKFRKKILPKWGKTPLPEITSEALEKWIASLALTGILIKSVRNDLTPMREAFDCVGSQFGVEKNPFAGVRLEKIWPEDQVESEYEADPWNDEERAAILNSCKAFNNQQWANMFQAWCWSGQRPQEILALKWESLDYVRGEIEIRRVLSVKRVEERTKTKSGRRMVPMHPLAREAFQQQKQFTFMKDHGFVFENPFTGKPWRHVTALTNYQWRTILKRAGVRYRGPGQCRHTYANLMLSNGENPMDVYKWMGHKTVQVLFDKYAHAMKGGKQGSKAYAGDYSKVAI